jgi:hypothetical protein
METHILRSLVDGYGNIILVHLSFEFDLVDLMLITPYGNLFSLGMVHNSFLGLNH